MEIVLSPAEKLEGVDLGNGWSVTSKIPKDPHHTGGYFSVGYNAESESGLKGFLKALDIKKVISSGLDDPITKLKDLTAAYVYERDLLKTCREHNLQNIVKSLKDGEIVIDSEAVPYIIFEMADSDIRTESNLMARFDITWALRTAHNVAVGLKQLHGKEIAHQDIKPSNILVFNKGDKKIGDLGRSAAKHCDLEHMDSIVTGDLNHAPPEGLYGYVHANWRERRYGCDTYQLGSLIGFMITGQSMSVLLQSAIDESLRRGIWRGSYEDVLPYLIEAHVRVVDYIGGYIPDCNEKQEILEIITNLTNPDIDQRGDSVKRGMNGNPFSMERFVSKLDRLSRTSERSLLGK